MAMRIAPARTAVLLATIFAAVVRRSAAQCPNMCSGHGECGKELVCACDSEWSYYPDCSGQYCPTGPAFSSKAYSTDVAHTLYVVRKLRRDETRREATLRYYYILDGIIYEFATRWLQNTDRKPR